MATQGFFNHYDDPDDEYWDRAPSESRAADPSVTGSRLGDANVGQGSENGSAAAGLPQRSSLVHVEVGDDRLPRAVNLARSWKESLYPSEYAGSIMAAYQFALYERTLRLVESGSRIEPTRQPLRVIVPILLRARSYDDYLDISRKMFGDDATYVVHGPGLDEFNKPTLTVRANQVEVISINIDPEWAQSASPFAISHDIIDCADRIRSMKGTYTTDEYLDRESDAELYMRLAEHQGHLLRNEE